MNIESLKSFCLIAKAGNISNVTKSVHLTQSALSQQIQKLENELSKKLFVRSNNGVDLTANGKIVFKHAQNILSIHDKMLEELTKTENSNIINIQACNTMADYVLPCTLITAKAKHPTYNYELASNPSIEIMTNVSNNLCDIGFCCLSDIKDDSSELIIEKVGVIKIVLVSNNTKLFPDEISIDRLKDSCLISFTERNSITSKLSKNLKKLGYDENCFSCNLHVESIESAKKLVLRNYGIAFLPYNSIKEELYKKQFKIISIPELDMDLDITMLYKNKCTGPVKNFVLWFKKHGTKSFC